MTNIRIILTAIAMALTSCAVPPNGPVSRPAEGLQPAILFLNSDIVVRLLGSKNQPRMTSRCWIYVQLDNVSDRDQKPSFSILLLDRNGNTLNEAELSFPTVLPQKSFQGTHYTFTDWTCDRIGSVKLSPRVL
jgi:hypothetical protein